MLSRAQESFSVFRVLFEIQIEMPQLDKLTYFSQFFWLCLLGPHPRAGLKLVI